MSRNFLDSIAASSKSFQNVLIEMAKTFDSTLQRQQDKCGKDLERMQMIIEKSEKIVELYKQLADKVVCLDHERFKKEGKKLQEMVISEKETMRQKYEVPPLFVEQSDYQQLFPSHEGGNLLL